MNICWFTLEESMIHACNCMDSLIHDCNVLAISLSVQFMSVTGMVINNILGHYFGIRSNVLTSAWLSAIWMKYMFVLKAGLHFSPFDFFIEYLFMQRMVLLAFPRVGQDCQWQLSICQSCKIRWWQIPIVRRQNFSINWNSRRWR